MTDRFGRPVRGLRISVTNRCNLNCFFCHSEGYLRRKDELGPDEIRELTSVAKEELGIKEVKITGGEPLLRRDICEIIEGMSDLEVSMTTNGTLLAPLAPRLANAGLKRVNVDLPTLSADKYKLITGRRCIDDVLEGIKSAQDAGLRPIKVNMVLLRGVNDQEIEHFIEFCSRYGLILQLIELLPLKRGLQPFWVDLKEVENKIHKLARKVETRPMHFRKKYYLDNCVVEIVKPMHNPQFCMNCFRLRVTPDGFLKPCLLRNNNLVDAREALKKQDRKEISSALKKAVQLREPYFRPTFQKSESLLASYLPSF